MGDDDEEWNQPGKRPSYAAGILDNHPIPYAERTKIFPIKRSKNKDED
jgi:hypothetical protein